MSRHRYVKKRNRSKLAKLVAASAFTLTTASTATALAWPSTGAAASQADLASFTQSQAPVAAQQSRYNAALHTEQIAATQAAQAAAKAATAQAAAAAQAAQAAQAAAAKQAAAQKAAAQKAAAQKAAAAVSSGSPQQIADAMLSQFGWSSGQMSCLQPLWQRESNWRVTAYNAGSGAYGIPQALPGSKMASAGPDWQGSASTQIKWGLEYIKNMYGSPCAAWSHEEADGWY